MGPITPRGPAMVLTDRKDLNSKQNKMCGVIMTGTRLSHFDWGGGGGGGEGDDQRPRPNPSTDIFSFSDLGHFILEIGKKAKQYLGCVSGADSSNRKLLAVNNVYYSKLILYATKWCLQRCILTFYATNDLLIQTNRIYPNQAHLATR